MKKRAYLFSILACLSLLACGVAQSDCNQLIEENINLKQKVDQLENGEKRLIAEVNQAFESGEYKVAKEKINKLKVTHPQSDKNIEFEALIAKLMR